MIAQSSEIWGNFLYSKYRAPGGSGEGGDWNQQVNHLKAKRKKETTVSFFYDCMF